MPQDIEVKRMADSPLARIQQSRRPSQAQPRLRPPEFLRLPDGRQFCTQDLLSKTTPAQTYNLRNKNQQRPINRRPTAKYTNEDFAWMVDATVEDIQQRYNINATYAMALRARSRNIIWWGKKP